MAGPVKLESSLRPCSSRGSARHVPGTKRRPSVSGSAQLVKRGSEHLVGSQRLAAVTTDSLKSEAERFVEGINLDESSVPKADTAALPVDDALTTERQRVAELEAQVGKLQSDVDAAYRACFKDVQLSDEAEAAKAELEQFSEAAFARLGRNNPQGMKALLTAKQRTDPQGWQAFQKEVSTLKLRSTRVCRELEDALSALDSSAAMASLMASDTSAGDDDSEDAEGRASSRTGTSGTCRIVLISGFESFNVDLYKQAAQEVASRQPGVHISVFSDRDLGPHKAKVQAALQEADVFFGSLLFDFDQVEWLRQHINNIPVRLVFESALELMSTTQIGSFQMDPSGKSKGPPPAVKKVLSLFGSGREEDRMTGYLSFLKIGPKLLRFLPGKKARDLKNWLTVYGYWNQGGLENITTMMLYLVDSYFFRTGAKPTAPLETPSTGCLHPDHEGYFDTPASYMRWYRAHGPLRDNKDAPVVAMLLYRKHVITKQGYIPQLIRTMEEQGVLPVPIFINGVEAHTVVRDQLTSQQEQAFYSETGAKAASEAAVKPRQDAVSVDAIVSTIGFPLVGGPAGTMEGGRQAEVAKAILQAKNVPYIVAAPLLIQDMASWSRDGVAGLQSVVLYSLPELDGAIDTVPLGGLVGEGIFLSLERVRRLAVRLRNWVSLRRLHAKERKIAILLYGFPPGVGATGTAALLNVPRSLSKMLDRLRAEGYDLGEADGQEVDGEALIAALKSQQEQRAIAEGARGVERWSEEQARSIGAVAVGADVSPKELREALSFPQGWGPSEWGPMPYLPDPDFLVQRMESQWGSLFSYSGLATSAKGNLVVGGIQLGNVWIGVQPALGIEGDPMRLLFERDLTPHPQYAAFYHWLTDSFGANAIVHFGMHGTAEWLPGAPLGNTGLSWADVLLGKLPNIYVYAANNPSESIIAKRRGYATIVSHNVPPYGRAGLYKQLAEVKSLVAEFREDPEHNAALRGPIVENLRAAGLQKDCPLPNLTTASSNGAAGSNGHGAAAPDVAEGHVEGEPELTAEAVMEIPVHDFAEYAGRLYSYLQVVEGRLFSEGLHTLGQAPNPEKTRSYLAAYFGERLPEVALDEVSHWNGEDLEGMRQRLERSLQQGTASTSAPSRSEPAGTQDFGPAIEEAVQVRQLLQRNTEELTGVLTALSGGYVLPEAGGDLLRDGPGVLPTGRNIHALDPYRMPSAAALERGTAAAEAILTQHQAANDGAWPETVAVNLWGLDAIKTKGESVAIVLHMLGARPLAEGTGRVARFELIPLAELQPEGRPRVDVLCNMSGIFRDSFQNVVELLDDLFQRAAMADEPPELNFVRKHASSMESEGLANPGARLFSNPAGDYGSMVNERVGASDWESGDELGSTWAIQKLLLIRQGPGEGNRSPR
ncbi:hypothetical protein WJX73_009512, partial [Symbiochloris irregularis]